MQKYTLMINSCGISDCNENWQWDSIGLRDYDLWAVFRGKGTLTVGEKCLEIEEGNCVLIPRNKPIVGRHDKGNPLYTMNVHFDVLQNGEMVYPFELEQRFVLNSAFFKELLNRVVFYYYRDKKFEAVNCLSVALQEFFASSLVNENTKTENSHLELVHDICKKINTSLASNSSLSSLAKDCGYSPTYLGKLFHKITGFTFTQYVLNARISQAKSLLKNTDKTITEIAEDLGYYDSCHFIKQFKTVTGYSPKKYR